MACRGPPSYCVLMYPFPCVCTHRHTARKRERERSGASFSSYKDTSSKGLRPPPYDVNLFYLFIGPISKSHWGLGLHHMNLGCLGDTAQSRTVLGYKLSPSSVGRFYKLMTFDFYIAEDNTNTFQTH